MRVLTGKLVLDHRRPFEVCIVVVLVAAFLSITGAADFDETLDPSMRANLYNALATTAGTLLGFVLAALAVLVALPSSERLVKLQAHPSWPLIPSTYFRAARALLAALLLCLLGLPLDSASDPWIIYEAIVVLALSLSLVRVIAAAVALDQILTVAQADKTDDHTSGTVREIDDPGP